ncbi:MAG: hypothetical protein NZ552_06230 [Planctomycetes bacterium]|nr:hypothetical protein [Planctomycetota bacterium]
MRRSLLGTLLLTLAAALGALEDQSPFKPGVRYHTYRVPGLAIHVPSAQRAQLEEAVARAIALYRRMIDDAGWQPTRTLHLVFTDDEDAHNGFSTVVPFPLVQVQLAPSRPESQLFAGGDDLERTLVHEFAHHLANDRNHGWRAALETVFGRVLPHDPLSLLVFLGSVPNHVLSPGFWHEAVAQWAETAYADPASPWAGRGRDPLVHAAWRLDAAAGGIPPPDTWRLSYERWPFGNRAYLYGLAYARWLAAAYGDRRGLWRVVEDQGRLQLPFAFRRGSEPSLGWEHPFLIAQARQDLQAEQQRMLALIRSQPVTHATRRSPAHWRIAAPAWMGERLVHAADSPTARPALAITSAQGRIENALQEPSAWMLGALRRVDDRHQIYAEAAVGGDRWRPSRARLVADGARVVREWPHPRVIQPDARRRGDSLEVVAVQFVGAGRQRLIRWRDDGEPEEIPSEGRPWAPAWRPGSDELCWVETDARGSRLVLARPDGGGRRVLWEVPARILHPAWDAAGERVFCASDVSGVANAWCVELAGAIRPVTNTIGAVLAAVPSPDGRLLAVLDHDQLGPFLAVMPLDERRWPPALPEVPHGWPAPIERQPLGPYAVGADRPDPAPRPLAPAALPEAEPYRALDSLRPRYWTPTTVAVPDSLGAFGAVAVAHDALLTHTVIASLGVGYHEHSAVGLLAWSYQGWQPGPAFVALRRELGYNEQLLASDGRAYDYVELVDSVEARLGYGMGGYGRRWQGWLAAGWERREPVDSAADDYRGLTVIGRQPWRGEEGYGALTLAYDDSILYPTSYAAEDGLSATASWRVGSATNNRALLQASYSQPVLPSWNHQLVLGAQLGWSDGPPSLQGVWGIGGDAALGVPRGYPKTMARGRVLLAGSAGYRLPLWQGFVGAGTTPWVTRQLVAELFYDGARVSDVLRRHQPGARWYRAAGVELHLEIEYWLVRVAPGLGLARQIDGEEDYTIYAALGFRW